MKRDRLTPTFWLGDPAPMLPRGQMDLPLVQAPRCGNDYAGFLPPCILPAGHDGRHTAGVALGEGLTDSWGTIDPKFPRKPRP